MGPIVARGVLLNVLDDDGKALAKGTPVTRERLQRSAARAGLTIERGDVVLVRSGARVPADGPRTR